jgi:cobalt/nickel transport system permease protein
MICQYNIRGESMTDWLFKEDNYVPPKDKDKFIDKSIFSVLKVLSNIRKENFKGHKNRLGLLNPVVKLLFTVILIIFISVTRDIKFIVIVGIANLILILFMTSKDISKIIYISLIIPFFTLITLLPSIATGNINNNILIIFKVFISVITVNILSFNTRWTELTKALKLFFVPDIFLLVFEITLKYIYILGEISIDMLYALRLRAVGKDNSKHTSISGIMGSLFLKSKDVSEEMYSAMECRGFTGEYTSITNFRLHIFDAVYIIYNLTIIFVYFFIN